MGAVGAAVVFAILRGGRCEDVEVLCGQWVGRCDGGVLWGGGLLRLGLLLLLLCWLLLMLLPEDAERYISRGVDVACAPPCGGLLL